MITPIKTMTVNQIAERKDDLIMSSDDIKELARNERNKAIEEFAEGIKKSKNAYTWCCTDSPMEFCGGDNCKECMNLFKKQIDEIAEQLKGEQK